MYRRRNSFLGAIAASMLLLNCTGPTNHATEQIGIRSDGYYQSEADKIVYMMRFSPQGNVVLTGGHRDNYKAMIDLLDPTKPDQNNVYNVAYTLLPNDSIYFYTVSPKGRIFYSGSAIHADTIRFLKESAINGKKAVLDYHFVPHQF